MRQRRAVQSLRTLPRPKWRGGDQGPEGRAHAFLDGPLDSDTVAEAHLELGGMDVDIHVLGRDLDAEEERRPVAGMNRGAVAGLCRAEEEGILEGPPVHEELRAPSGGLSLTGPLHESLHAKRARGVSDRYQGRRQILAPDRRQALVGLLSGRHGETTRAVHVQLEPGFRVGQRQRRHCVVRGAALARDRAEEFPARGGVIEERSHGDRGPALADGIRHAVEAAAGHARARCRCRRLHESRA